MHQPPWTNSPKLQAQFLLYTQIAVLKHTFFFKTLHTILCIWHNFHKENLLLSQGMRCHSKILKWITLLFTLTHHMGKHPDTLHNTLIPPDQLRYIVIWNGVSFHWAALVRNWFTAHSRFMVVYLPPYSLFLNFILFFSFWRCKVYDQNPQMRIPLLQAMEDACGHIAVGAFHGWIRHSIYLLPCICVLWV